MRSGRLYKYFSESRWANAFLQGELLFRSLSYFLDYEDEGVRQDENEGIAIYRPDGGLVINNHTQGIVHNLPDHAFEAEVGQRDIFIYCLSRSFTDDLRQGFNAAACVEIYDIPNFCQRIEAALPVTAKFPGLAGQRRIGRRVDYYEVTESATPRWALPDVIATSKLRKYAWQDEFRLVFSLTDALEFEKVQVRLQRGDRKRPVTGEHPTYLAKAGSLIDICKLYEF